MLTSTCLLFAELLKVVDQNLVSYKNYHEKSQFYHEAEYNGGGFLFENDLHGDRVCCHIPISMVVFKNISRRLLVFRLGAISL